MASICGSVSDRLLIEQDLLEGVGSESEPERLERDDFLGRDVSEVHLGAEVLHEVRLRGLRGSLEDDVAELDLVDDLVDQAGAHLPGRAKNAGRAALAALGDDLPGARLELL